MSFDITTLLTWLLAISFIWWIFSKRDKLAGIPGPYSFPIIGNIHQLRQTLWESLTCLSKRYGDVYRIKIGSRPAVVLNGHKAIKQALVNQAIDFAGRPEDLSTFQVFHSTRQEGGVYAGTTYGKTWAFRCNFSTDYFNDYATGSNKGIFEQHVVEETQRFIEFVLSKQSSPVFKAEVLTHHMIINLNTRLFYSEHLELDDPFLDEYLRIHEEYWATWERCAVFNVFPWLGYIFPAKRASLRAYILRIMDRLKTYADKHDAKDGGSKSNEDFLGHIKAEVSKLEPGILEEVGMTKNRMLMLVKDIFGPGSLWATVNWCFVYAANFPELQREMQEELDKVVGRDRLPAFADRDDLPLLNAFIEEVSRHSATGPLPPPHMTTKDTVLGGGYGYTIPEGTMVFVNLHSIYTDPKQWKNPEEFNPRRFLKEDGHSLDKEKVSSLFKFGAGIRKCPGWKVGALDVYHLLAIVLHQCTLKFAAGQEPTLKGTQFPFGIRAPRTQMELLRR